MNQLAVHKEKNGTPDEVYNFNKSAGSIMFMYDSGTSSFSYKGEGGTKILHRMEIIAIGSYELFRLNI